MSQAKGINHARLATLIRDLASFGAVGEGVNRQALTAEEGEARRFLIGWAERNGCSVHADPIGNLFFRREGEAGHPPVMTGSHIDTQPSGGRLDGAYGVCAGLEVLAALQEMGTRTLRSIEVVAWTNEEGCRFAPGSMGSAAFVAPERLSALLAMCDADGVSVADALAQVTETAHRHLPQVELGRPVHAYVEAHIEQGPLLEAQGATIGAVTSIQGVRWFTVTVTGAAAHAGTTPRSRRQDAMAGAAPLIDELLTMSPLDEDLRLTIGKVEVEPNAINTVPSLVRFTIDLRHPDLGAIELAEASIRAAVAALPDAYIDLQMCSDGVTFDPAIVAAVETAAHARLLPMMRLPSGAFHDALHLAAHCPTGMIFVPSRAGISHNPAEYTEQAHLSAGAEVLMDVLLELADQPAVEHSQ